MTTVWVDAMSGEYSVAFVDLMSDRILATLAFLIIFVLFCCEPNKHTAKTET